MATSKSHSECPSLEIRPSDIHGKGLFVKSSIPKNTRITQCEGEKIDSKELWSRVLLFEKKPHKLIPELNFIFKIDDSWRLDIRKRGSFAYTINHSCSPNCKFVNQEGEVWLVSLEEIEPESELVCDYSKCNLRHLRSRPCSCGSKDCIGYIVAEDEREKAKELLNKRFHEVAPSQIDESGLFANCDIEEGTDIIEYTGKKLTAQQATDLSLDKRKKGESSIYLFRLNDDVYIDGAVDGNEARLINHSCDENCRPISYSNKMWIVASRDIKKGEELTFDYGLDTQDFQNRPCNCGAKDCAGYIVGKTHRKQLKILLDPPCEVSGSSIHNRGLFATDDLKEDTQLIQYIGEEITLEEASKRTSVYLFKIEDDLLIDGEVGGNNSRFANHSCDPNCEMRFNKLTEELWLYTKKEVKKGAELTFNYSYNDLKAFKENPCNCGAPNCFGYILSDELKDKAKKILEEEQKQSAAK